MANTLRPLRWLAVLLLLLCALLLSVSAESEGSSVNTKTNAVETPRAADATTRDANLGVSGSDDSGGLPVQDSFLPKHLQLSSLRFLGAFLSSMSMIVVSEIGDKTFFIAAIMAMRHTRGEVFLSAMTALALMTGLSAAMGFTLPNLLPPHLTHALATLLFFFFGVKLLYDASKMEAGVAPLDELEEVEHELQKREGDMETASLVDLEKSDKSRAEQKITGTDISKAAPRIKTLMRKFFSPIFIQCFTMTFLAEWGDRSQIATIALAAAKDPYGVTFGGITGHAICTGVAVIGGKLLATKISEKTIAAVGGLLFLAFSVHSVLWGDV